MSDAHPSLEHLPAGHRALRSAVALARHGRTVPVWLRGEGAREAALAVSTSRLLLRDGQAQQSLLLDAEARPLADVTICSDDEDYLLVVDGMTAEALHGHLRAATAEIADLRIEEASATHEVLGVHGPFAWELCAEALGQDLMALPYLNFFRIDEGIALRSGKTGEFGYELVVRREQADEVSTKLHDAGKDFDAEDLTEEALSLAQFEAWFFDPRFVPEGATPLELQLQWRLSARDFLGRPALDARRLRAARQPGLARKLVCVLLSGAAQPGDAASLFGENVGAIVRVARSPMTGLHFGSVLLSERIAHGGIALDIEGGIRARTIAPPLLDNRSLYVDPRRHSYRTRDEIAFGPWTRHAPVEDRA